MGVVTTIVGRCKRCYSCVRNCPAKAIKIEEGQAMVMEERCIACGTCVKACSQNAKQIESGIEKVYEFLSSNGKHTVAALAPSFVAAFNDIKPGKLITALKRLGFSHVMEVAYGAKLIVRQEYTRLITEQKTRAIITTPCPALVSYIEKYATPLLPYLAPVVSPLIALGRYIKKYLDPEAKVVFIGPCIAKKEEIKDPCVAGAVEAAITYKELKQIFSEKSIEPARLEESEFDAPHPKIARSFPISGGLLRTASKYVDILDNDVIVTEGKDRTLKLLDELMEGKLESRFLDLLFCEGCIDGPVMDNDLELFTRKEIVAKYVRENYKEDDEEEIPHLDLSREYRSLDIKLSVPTEEQIKEVLKAINKTKPEDELNCGSCGYSSCREKAIAVCQGLAENEMCLPYLIEKLQDYLIQREKMSSLGQMAASIAHEINNPIGGVLIYTRLLLKRLASEELNKETFQKNLMRIETEINRCSKIIRNLLDFSRQSPPALRLVDINKTLEDALSMIEHQAQLGNVKIVKNMEEKIPEITADYDQMRQVFINILLNAIQAMPSGGTLTLKTQIFRPQKEVLISISDTGCGISREDLKKLFTPFFSTREKGVGLGLAVVQGIVEKHEGKIEVESQENKGTTFTIRLKAN